MAHLCLTDAIQTGIVNLGQPAAHTRIDAPRMQHTLDGAHLLAPLRGRTTRHHRLLIPAQTPRDLAKRCRLALKCHQIFISTHRVIPLTDWNVG